MNIVLHEPENPQNAGNIGRTCVVTGSVLHLIRPLGFFTGSKDIKRAGLDYWDKLDVRYYDNFAHFLECNPTGKIFMATTKAKKTYTDVFLELNDFIMFGKESSGIPEEILVNYSDYAIRIPMLEEFRSLNLATSVGIILFEALRQNGFQNLQSCGNMRYLSWE